MLNFNHMHLKRTLIFIVFLKCIIMATAKYDCSSKGVIYLNLNEIAFFESTNYPKLLTMDEATACNLTFSLKTGNNSKTIKAFAGHIMIGAGNAHYNNERNDVEVVVFNLTTYSAFQTEDPLEHNAFQGMLVFLEDKNNCPMETIARDEPFQFEDETQIFYLLSKFDLNQTRISSCRWRFKAPHGYGLKVVIQNFNFDKTTNFMIQNTTVIIVNIRSVQLLHPYYNDDSYIEISITEDFALATYSSVFTFQASVSVVKKDAEIIDANCTVTEEAGGVVTWSNVHNFESGYDNNARCTYDLIIEGNIEIWVVQVFLALESDSNLHLKIKDTTDVVRYFPDEFTSIVQIKKQEHDFVLLPYKNGSARHVLWEFVSDGSVQSLGFTYNFHTLECECIAGPIPCDGQFYGIEVNGKSEYCGNLRCNIPLKPCHSVYSILTLNPVVSDYKSYSDVFRIITNGSVVLEINIFNVRNSMYVYLSSEKEYIFEVETHRSIDANKLTLMIDVVVVSPSVQKCVLSKNVTNCVLDLGAGNFGIIEAEDSVKNRTFIIYSTDEGGGITIYNNESLTFQISSRHCFTGVYPDPSEFKCEISDYNKFAVIGPFNYPFLAVRLADDSFSGCVFRENIFVLTSVISIDLNVNSGDQTVTALASPEKECRLTILIDREKLYYISHLWTTAVTENVKLFVGTENPPQIFLEFNYKTAENWKSIPLRSKVYTILIPPKRAVLFTFSFDYDLPYSLEYPFYSMIASPHYKTSKMNTNFQNRFVRYNIGATPLQFTALDFNLSQDDDFYFSVNKTKIRINKTGDVMIFKNQKVALYYLFDPSPATRGVMFYVNTINETA